jgi:hypothetical protein
VRCSPPLCDLRARPATPPSVGDARRAEVLTTPPARSSQAVRVHGLRSPASYHLTRVKPNHPASGCSPGVSAQSTRCVRGLLHEQGWATQIQRSNSNLIIFTGAGWTVQRRSVDIYTSLSRNSWVGNLEGAEHLQIDHVEVHRKLHQRVVVVLRHPPDISLFCSTARSRRQQTRKYATPYLLGLTIKPHLPPPGAGGLLGCIPSQCKTRLYSFNSTSVIIYHNLSPIMGDKTLVYEY